MKSIPETSDMDHEADHHSFTRRELISLYAIGIFAILSAMALIGWMILN